MEEIVKKINGVITALITPFKKGGNEVDMSALEKLIARQLEAKVNGLAVCATTGESSSLSLKEKTEIWKMTVKLTSGKCMVIAGTGTNNITSTIENIISATECGCDAALVITPYYNKPTQEGLYRYYMKICDNSQIPVLLYNVPSRTSVDMTPDTVLRIAKHEKCVGIKEASGIVTRVFDIKQKVNKPFTVLSGDDATFLPFLACGGDGIICTSSNLIPEEVVSIYNLWKNRKIEEAQRLHGSLMDVFKVMFIETNPGPVKYALSKMGLIEPEIRLPLVLPDPQSASGNQIDYVLRNHSLIK